MSNIKRVLLSSVLLSSLALLPVSAFAATDNGNTEMQTVTPQEKVLPPTPSTPLHKENKESNQNQDQTKPAEHMMPETPPSESIQGC